LADTIEQMNTDARTIGIIASGSISAFLIARLWMKKEGCSAIDRILWTIVLILPVIGWIFFACFHNPPSVQPKELQGRFSGRGVGSLLLSIRGRRRDNGEP